MREYVTQTVKFRDCFNNRFRDRQEITMRISIDVKSGEFSFECSDHVSLLMLFEIISANKLIRKITDDFHIRGIFTVSTKHKTEYWASWYRIFHLMTIEDEYGYQIDRISYIRPGEFYSILFHIFRNECKLEPKINENYKHHRNFLRKNADFRYCKAEWIDGLSLFDLAPIIYHNDHEEYISLYDDKVDELIAAHFVDMDKERNEVNDSSSCDDEFNLDLEDEELGFGFEDDGFDFDDDFDLGDEDEWK